MFLISIDRSATLRSAGKVSSARLVCVLGVRTNWDGNAIIAEEGDLGRLGLRHFVELIWWYVIMRKLYCKTEVDVKAEIWVADRDGLWRRRRSVCWIVRSFSIREAAGALGIKRAR